VRRDFLADVSRDRFHRAHKYQPHLRDGMEQSHTAHSNQPHAEKALDCGVAAEGAVIRNSKRAGKIDGERGKQGGINEASVKAAY
jgi:hypothetical protein